MSAMTNIWEMLEEEAPPGCFAIQDLYSWSLNFESGKGPMTLFLDLIGWSEDNIGEALYDVQNLGLGYVELDKLGAALTAYASRPQDVREYVDALLEAESQD